MNYLESLDYFVERTPTVQTVEQLAGVYFFFRMSSVYGFRLSGHPVTYLRDFQDDEIIEALKSMASGDFSFLYNSFGPTTEALLQLRNKKGVEGVDKLVYGIYDEKPQGELGIYALAAMTKIVREKGSKLNGDEYLKCVDQIRIN